MLLGIAGDPGLTEVHRAHLSYFHMLRQGHNAGVTGPRVGAGMDRLTGKISWGKEEEMKSEA